MNYLTIPFRYSSVIVSDELGLTDYPLEPQLSHIRIAITDPIIHHIRTAQSLVKQFGDYPLLYPQFNFDYPHDLEMAIMNNEVQIWGYKFVNDNDKTTYKLDIHPQYITRLTFGIRFIEGGLNLEFYALSDDNIDDGEYLWEIAGSKFINEYFSKWELDSLN